MIGSQPEYEREKAIRRRNRAWFLVLATAAVLLYAATLLRIEG